MEIEDDGGIISNMKWKVRSALPLKIDSIGIMEGRYLAIAKGDSSRLMSLLRVGLAETMDDSKLDYSTAVKITLQQQRMKGLFDGLHRSKIPFLYLILVKPAEQGGDDNQVFEFDLVVGTWMDVKAKKATESMATLEQNTGVLAATLAVGVPNSDVRRLTRNELKDFGQNLLQPTEQKLRQVADSSTISRLESFDSRNPAVQSSQSAPEFYVPNAMESGTSGILLGKVRTRAGTSHDFRLQLDDLRRHTAILGMTGAGKSTSASVIVRQVAGMGLPLMILDWHNEHADLVRSIGGQIFSPGKDQFTINPLDMTSSTDPIEHIAMTTDIFSDIYHFTHPQAYMFRNALQRCLGEASEREVPTISSLVKIIEGYPLRSAYDNETKVALLRRLVPLTEGQVGRALNGPSSHSVDELLDKVLAIELGQIRDIQTRSVFVDILLKIIYEYRVSKRGKMEHLIVVEEARNIAPARREEDPPSVGERMISELRKFGEAIVFVAQFPTQVAAEVIKNSGVRIIHRVAWAEDLRLIGQALNLSKEQLAHVSTLGVGEAVVSLSRLQNPILVQVEAGSVLGLERRDLSLVEES
ncbi:MAG: ATP-binding protein [Thaumarchaeota archaeon]|nr:ATP-binding protein [Nitrososphaerota archaeon]